MTGRLQPGERLIETKLAEMLRISRTPIREAIRKLEKEGLVVPLTSGGVGVYSLSRDDLKDLYDCRAALEGLAARQAALRITEEQIAELDGILKKTSTALDLGDIETVVRNNTRFHDAIIQASGNRRLQRIMDELRSQILQVRTVSLHILTRPGFFAEHQALFQALRKHDPREAETVAKWHIDNDCRCVLEGLEKLNPGPNTTEAGSVLESPSER